MQIKEYLTIGGFIIVFGAQLANYVKSNTIQNNELKHINEKLDVIQNDIKEVYKKEGEHAEKLAEHDKAIEILEKDK